MNNLFLSTLGLTCLIFSSALLSHEHHAKPDLHASDSSVSSGKIISGGYQYVPGLLALPKDVDIQHAHGLTRDKEDNIYLAYTSNSINKNTHAIIMFNKEGKFVRHIGDSSLAEEGPHGLDLDYENGKKYLYLSSYDSSVIKVTTDGKVIWRSSQAPATKPYKSKSYRPTDTAVHALSQQLFVADGYGSSKIIELNKHTGNVTGNIWSGEASGKHFSTPHGVTFDARKNKIVVADRENHRIVYFDKEGGFFESVEGQGISRTVNTDVWNNYLLVSNLDGTVAYLNKKNELIDTINLNAVLGDKGHKHPHDAIFMSNGDVVIGTWNPGFLSYWKRM